MKCQSLFSGKIEENLINLSSAELAQSIVKVKGIVYLYSEGSVQTGWTLSSAYTFKQLIAVFGQQAFV